jgi:hypothetical protein
MIRMKTLKIMLLLVLSTGFARAQFTKAQLQVSGLNCALCAKKTERSLKALPFINDIKPDLNHNTYVVTFKNNEPVNFDQLCKVMLDEGFFVNVLKATFNFDNVKLDGNFFSYWGDTFQLMNGGDKSIAGQVDITIIDKGFASRSVSKKYVSQFTAVNPSKPGRIYHVIM